MGIQKILMFNNDEGFRILIASIAYIKEKLGELL